MTRDNVNIWQDIELRIDTDPFCTSSQISPMNKKDRSKTTLKQKAPLKWVLYILFQKRHQNFSQVKVIILIIF